LTIENSFLPSLPRPGFLPGVSTYRTVQNCEATSQIDQGDAAKAAAEQQDTRTILAGEQARGILELTPRARQIALASEH
jgi:hypothetical protein